MRKQALKNEVGKDRKAQRRLNNPNRNYQFEARHPDRLQFEQSFHIEQCRMKIYQIFHCTIVLLGTRVTSNTLNQPLAICIYICKKKKKITLLNQSI